MPDRSGPIQRIYGEFPPGQPKRGRCRTVRWPAHRKPAWTTPFRGDLAMSALGCFDYAVSSNGSFSVVGVPAGIGRPNSASSAASAVPSDRCGVEDLLLPFDPGSEARVGLDLRPGWVKRWSASWRVAGEEVVNPVGDLGSAPLAVCEPVRRFSWHPRQRHRPGLQFMVSTGRHHGFESLAEQRLLLALDFAGAARVVSQPFRLRVVPCDGWRDHTPDFVGVLGDGSIWVLDVRPRGRVDKQARVCFAATAEVALAAGWRYAVVTAGAGHAGRTVCAAASPDRPARPAGRARGGCGGGAVRVRRVGRGDLAACGGPGTRPAPAVASQARRRPGGAAARHLAGLAWTGRLAVRAGGGLLDLSPGARLLLGGSEVLVEWVEPQHSLVMVCGLDGQA